MEMGEALDVMERFYQCETNEDEAFCGHFEPDGKSLCARCPYDVSMETRTEAVRVILEAHGRLKEGGEA